MSISYREFRASLASYVRKEDDGSIRDQREKLLQGFTRLGLEGFDLIASHDLAAALTCACRPDGDKVVCGSPALRAYLDEVGQSQDKFEKDLSKVLAKALTDVEIRHLVWRGTGLVPKPADILPEESPEEESAAPPVEPGSLFDTHAEGEV